MKQLFVCFFSAVIFDPPLVNHIATFKISNLGLHHNLSIFTTMAHHHALAAIENDQN